MESAPTDHFASSHHSYKQEEKDEGGGAIYTPKYIPNQFGVWYGYVSLK